MSEEQRNQHLDKYKPEYCELLIAHMGEGYSFESFGAVVRVSKKTLYNWCDRFPDFADAKGIAEAHGLKYFETALKSVSMKETIDEKIIQKKFNPKNINTNTIMWFMKTRYHSVYNEKNTMVIEGGEKPVEHNHNVNLKNLSLEELKNLQAIQLKLNEPSKSE